MKIIQEPHTFTSPVTFRGNTKGIDPIYSFKRDFGARGDGNHDDTQAMFDVLSLMDSKQCKVKFEFGTYLFTKSFPITRRGLYFIGERDGRPTQGGGTRFIYAPTSVAAPTSLFQLGTSGVAGDPFFDASYDSNSYDGPQEFYMQDISMAYGGSGSVNLTRGGTYGPNTVGIRDFKGGDIHLNNVWFEHFDYPFWGIQSDFDEFMNVRVLNAKHGLYFGPRSDQFIGINVQVTGCDQGVWLDRCAGHTWNRFNCIDNGSGTTDVGVRIGSQYAADGCHEIVFNNPWFENEGAGTDPNVEAFMEIGRETDLNTSQTVTIRNPVILTNPQANQPHTQYLLRVGKAFRITVEYPGPGLANLLKPYKFTSDTVNAHINHIAHDDLAAASSSGLYDNVGAAIPIVSTHTNGYGSHTFGGFNGRILVNYTTQPLGYANNYFIGSESQFAFFVNFPNRASTGGTANILAITRRIQHGSAIPVSGTWTIGDRILNNAPAVGSPKSWVCTVSGTPGTWVSEGNL